jgi:hypothetical protein
MRALDGQRLATQRVTGSKAAKALGLTFPPSLLRDSIVE